MYTIFESGGTQHKVTLGETLKISKIDAEVGAEVTIPEVLLVANGENIAVGTPIIDQASVKVEVLSHGKADKVRTFKKKRRKGFRKTIGHRQQYTEVFVKEVTAGSDNFKAEDKSLQRARSRTAALLKLKLPMKKVKKEPV